MKPNIYLTTWALLALVIFHSKAIAQQIQQPDLLTLRFSSSHTAFPEKKRAAGYTNDGRIFDAAGHYSDSSVLLVYSKYLHVNKKVDLVFWFHGWNNNIDTAMAFYQLAEQWQQAHRNAVLVLAETAKNAADSYGGKLEQPLVFTGLVNDILTALRKNSIIPKKTMQGNIILAGHSGAYRVMAHIVQYGGMPIQELDLFDALYSQTDKFMAWINANPANRFINWYTNHGGGTDEVSIQLMADLKKAGIPYLLSEEKDLQPAILKQNRLLFVHTDREHNDIINKPDNFTLLLNASLFLSGIR